MFPGSLTQVLTQLFFPKPPTNFFTCYCRGERRKYAGKKFRLIGDQTHNNQVMSPTHSPLSHPGGVYQTVEPLYFSGLFDKQTSHGWDHKVEVTLNVSQHVLTWNTKGKHRRNVVRTLPLTRLERVVKRTINGNVMNIDCHSYFFFKNAIQLASVCLVLPGSLNYIRQYRISPNKRSRSRAKQVGILYFVPSLQSKKSVQFCILEMFKPFRNKPWFLSVCNTNLLKTQWEKEKLLVTSNFSFFHSVF